jgi:hypothetical protein
MEDSGTVEINSAILRNHCSAPTEAANGNIKPLARWGRELQNLPVRFLLSAKTSCYARNRDGRRSKSLYS